MEHQGLTVLVASVCECAFVCVCVRVCVFTCVMVTLHIKIIATSARILLIVKDIMHAVSFRIC